MMNGNTFLGQQTAKPIIGAGGWSTGIQTAADGAFLMRRDTYGADFRAPGANVWTQELIAGVTIAVSDIDVRYKADGSQPDPGGSFGTFAAALAWSDSSVRYLAVMGYLMVKKIGASMFTRTSMPQRLGLEPNATARMRGNPLEVDPANPRVVWFGTPLEGVCNSVDQGDTMNYISTATLPLPTGGGRYIIRFDRSSAVIGVGAAARTQRIYIFIPGSGLYKSENAGSTWALMAARPTNPLTAGSMKINPANGYIYLAGLAESENESKLSHWDGVAWNETLIKPVASVAISPTNPTHIYAFGSGGGCLVSTDNGLTWGTEEYSNYSISSYDVPWQVAVEGYKSMGDVEFSQIENSIYMSGGVGAWKIPNPPTIMVFNTYPVMVGISKGNESMVSSGAVIAPDGTVGITMHDRGCMIYAPGQAGKTFASAYGPSPGSLSHGMTCDYAPEDNAFWIATYTYATGDNVGWTPDRGATWNRIYNLPVISGGRGGGQCVCITKDIWIVAQLTDFAWGPASKPKNALYLTTNARVAGGEPTWTEIPIGNGNAVEVSRTFNTFRRTMMKNRFTTGNLRKAVFYNPAEVEFPNSANAVSCRGWWEIEINVTTGAFTVTRPNNTIIWPSNTGVYGNKIAQVGLNDWLMCGGDNAMGLKRSINGGVDWNNITGTDDQGAGDRFTEVYGCAVGKKHPSSAFPTLYAMGYRLFADGDHTNDHSKFALWESRNDGVTWLRVLQFPEGNFDGVIDVTADPERYGMIIINRGGTGSIMLNLNDFTLGLEAV